MTQALDQQMGLVIFRKEARLELELLLRLCHCTHTNTERLDLPTSQCALSRTRLERQVVGQA